MGIRQSLKPILGPLKRITSPVTNPIKNILSGLLDGLVAVIIFIFLIILLSILITISENALAWEFFDTIPLEVHNTVENLLLITGVSILWGFTERQLDRDGWLKRVSKFVVRYGWRIGTVGSVPSQTDDGLNVNRNSVRERRRVEIGYSNYLEIASEQIPAVTLIALFPPILLRLYTGSIDPSALGILYIILGVLFGGYDSAFGNPRAITYPISDAERIREEVRSIIASQIEILYIIIASLAQFVGFYNAGPAELFSTGFAILAVGLCFLAAILIASKIR